MIKMNEEEIIKKMCNDIYEGESWQPMIDLIKNKNKRIEELKNGLHKILKLNEYMIHCSSKRVINKLILKQWYLIYKVLGEQRPGIAFSSKENEVIVLTQQRDLYKEVIEKANNELITLIQIIMEQPSKNVEEDNYLLSRLESISNILVGGNNECI